MGTRIKRTLNRVKFAAIGAAAGASLGALVSRNAASTAAGVGALVGATIGEKRSMVETTIDQIKSKKQS